MKALMLTAAALVVGSACAHDQQRPRGDDVGTVVQLQVYSKAIDGNLTGDSPTRDVSVYLPPSYNAAHRRRYPVLYLLHGSSGTNLTYFREGAATHVPTIADRTLQAGTSREMIIVTPNGNSVYGGSNYSSGVATGDFETFIAKELVEYIDRNFRTIARPEGRGLSGHSMGGYGTWRIAMKHPNVYSAIYVLSSCCIGATSNLTTDAAEIAQFENWYNTATTTPTTASDIPAGVSRTNVQAAAAWAPNPKRPPLYFDMPFKNGQQIREVVDRMTTNRPLTMVDQYIDNLRKLAVAFDVGDEDTNIAANLTEMDRILTAYQVPHTFEIYHGNHNNRIPERVELKVLPFFAQHLEPARDGKR